jgi:hypothetical protein
MTSLLQFGFLQPSPHFQSVLHALDLTLTSNTVPTSLENDLCVLRETNGINVGFTLFAHVRDTLLHDNQSVELIYEQFTKIKPVLDLLSRIFAHDFGLMFLDCINSQISIDEITKEGVKAYMRVRNGEATKDDEHKLLMLKTISQHTKLNFTPFEIELPFGEYNEEKLPSLIERVHVIVSGFAEYSGQDWGERMHFYMYNELCKLRIGELFDIIVDFPDSKPALLDLKECLSKTGIYNDMIQSFKKAYRQISQNLHITVYQDVFFMLVLKQPILSLNLYQPLKHFLFSIQQVYLFTV